MADDWPDYTFPPKRRAIRVSGDQEAAKPEAEQPLIPLTERDYTALREAIRLARQSTASGAYQRELTEILGRLVIGEQK